MAEPTVLLTESVDEKLRLIAGECHRLLLNKTPRSMASLGALAPARNVSVVHSHSMPSRAGLQSPEGQGRLLHDLANIELQAMELGVRALHEYADAPNEFRHGIAEIVLEEAKHLTLCLHGLRELGFDWGAWPIHNMLWESASESDSLLDRILIVNCYLEASGLDSGEMILRRLSGVTNRLAREIVAVIAHEEVQHVQFGLKWYRWLCAKDGLNSSDDYVDRLNRLFARVPARATTINEDARERAGFTSAEIDFIKNFSKKKQVAARAQNQSPA